MAIIQCSNCRKRISDKHQICNHCSYPLTDLTESTKELREQAIKTTYRQHRKKLRQTQTYALILVVAFVGSFLAWWFAQQNNDEMLLKLSQASMIISAIAYLGIRIWQLIIQYQYKNK